MRLSKCAGGGQVARPRLSFAAALLEPEPVEVGVAVLAGLADARGEEADLGADPAPRPRREGLADGREALAVHAVAEVADRAFGNLHAQVDGVALQREPRALSLRGLLIRILADDLRDEEAR